jgi:hypothetical protein
MYMCMCVCMCVWEGEGGVQVLECIGFATCSSFYKYSKTPI